MGVTAVDLVDETWIAAAPEAVAAVAHDPARWRLWWPDLDLVVFQDRGTAGLRWSCTGALVGSCELWLQAWGSEAFGPGVLVHHYLRADPTRRGSRTEPVTGLPVRKAVALRDRRARAWKVAVHAWKDELEAGRVLGPPDPAPADERPDPAASPSSHRPQVPTTSG